MAEEIQSKYHPFTEEEFIYMKAEMETMGYNLPRDEQIQIKIWVYCEKIRGKRENRPCTCKSGVPLWKRCFDDINTFIRERA